MTRPTPRRFRELRNRFWLSVLLVKAVVLAAFCIALYLVLMKTFPR